MITIFQLPRPCVLVDWSIDEWVVAIRFQQLAYPSKSEDGTGISMLLNIGRRASYVIKHAGGALCIAPCRYGYRGRRGQIGLTIPDWP